MPAFTPDFNHKYQQFLNQIGLCMVAWQQVEEMHFCLFNKISTVNDEDICSIIYYSPPSFEARRTLVKRIAEFYLTDFDYSELIKLDKRAEKSATNRNAVAHYTLDFWPAPGFVDTHLS